MADVREPDEAPHGAPDEATGATPGERSSRRDFLGRAGRSAAVVAGGGLLAHQLVPHGHPAEAAEGPHVERATIGAGGGPAELIGEGARGEARAGGHAYGSSVEPPAFLTASSLDALTIPPPRDGRPAGTVRELGFVVSERQLQVGDGVYVDGWTYEGTAPGPVIRATEGDRLRLTVRNLTAHPHNLHLHGRHAPTMDGWEPIPPGGEFTYDVTAAPAGFHPYHCHTAPLAEHISRGLYGAMIVDPVEPRPEAHEFVLVLSGFDVDGDGTNEVYAWNGVAGYFSRFPLKVPVGDLVRLYVLNMTEYDPVASFHLHAETFDVFRSGTGTVPDEHTDTVALTQGERAILEFRLPERGRYMFHPHQHRLAERGAMGWIAAV